MTLSAAIILVPTAGTLARPPGEVLAELDALVGPTLDESRRADKAYFQTYLDKSAKHLRRRATLIRELFESDPGHARLAKLLPSRWRAVEWTAAFERAPQILKEIDAAAKRFDDPDFKREVLYWRAAWTFYDNANGAGDFETVKTAIDSFLKRHGKDRRGANLLWKRAGLATRGSSDHIGTLKRLVEMFPDHRMATDARGVVRRVAALNRPFAMEFTDVLTGRRISTKDSKGKVIVLDFWATWCGPCKAEHPALMELDRKYRERGLLIIGISLDAAGDAGAKAIRKYAKKKKLDWPQFHDADRSFSQSYGIVGIPRYFVIDRSGRLVSTEARGKLETLLPELLGR